MRITIAQLNPKVGDIKGNLQKVFAVLEKYAEKTDLIIFPEMFITGYPPKDLLDRPWFIKKVDSALHGLLKKTKKYSQLALIIGAPTKTAHNTGRGLHNSALFISNGKILLTQPKTLLPTYDVFDEARHFDKAKKSTIVRFKGEKIGMTICEDVWTEYKTGAKKRYKNDPVAQLIKQKASLLINISASPFTLDKEKERLFFLKQHAKKHRVPLVYVNQVGGNDELIFDGRSICFNAKGELTFTGKAFEEEVATIDLASAKKISFKSLEKMKALHDALVLGLRDYFNKCGFSKAVLGLSGGVDSALVAYLAARALGQENVLGISMPSIYSSEGSISDAELLAKNLGIAFQIISIKEVHHVYAEIFNSRFQGPPGTAEENIQARIRGNIVMAFSNKYGYLTLSTGNKSEHAVGYCTLYGDMSGGLSVISDVPKTMVYELCRFINREKIIIPQSIIDKAPSAELRPNQTDQDTLPPYKILDDILYAYIEKQQSLAQMSRKFDSKIVHWVIKNVDRSEYKRKQAAPGLKITSKAFGVGRRMPIAAKFEY